LIAYLNAAPYVLGMFDEAAILRCVIQAGMPSIYRRSFHLISAVAYPQQFKIAKRKKVLDALGAVPFIRSVARVCAALNNRGEHGAQAVIEVMLLQPRFTRREFRFVLAVIISVVGTAVFHGYDALSSASRLFLPRRISAALALFFAVQAQRGKWYFCQNGFGVNSTRQLLNAHFFVLIFAIVMLLLDGYPK
jgi:hypothetical protein